MVADCAPAFPPLSINSGIKNANAIAAASVSSNAEITHEDARFITTKTNSHGNLLTTSSWIDVFW